MRGKPKRVADRHRPWGIISIGYLCPWGGEHSGVVPMGVVSLGSVGMGVINATVVWHGRAGSPGSM